MKVAKVMREDAEGPRQGVVLSPGQSPPLTLSEPVPPERFTWGATRDQPNGAARPGDPGGPRGSHAARRVWPRRVRRTLLALVLVLVLLPTAAYLWGDLKLNRDVDLDEIEDRPPAGEGTNYLIVGSDSREGLSGEDMDDLHTGSVEGRRTDSIILLHTGENGTTMMSLPRDSWVTMPSFTDPATGKRMGGRRNKLNAAFSMGGPELLVRTVELNTDLRIDHYAEIGFAGFVRIVDAVGGVEMCLDRAIRDEKSGADLKKGCQVLDGADALAFVRQRHQEAQGDLDRTMNQQRFLAALASQAATPGVMFNPLTLYSTASAGLDGLIVDEDMSLPDLASMFGALRGVSGGDGTRVNVPVADTDLRTDKGSAVAWDTERAERLFDQLRNDQPVSIEATGGERK
jgi:LCP family protein required for cell wall assembly